MSAISSASSTFNHSQKCHNSAFFSSLNTNAGSSTKYARKHNFLHSPKEVLSLSCLTAIEGPTNQSEGEKVMAPPIPKAAMKKLLGKKLTGSTKRLVEALDSSSFTIIGDDSRLNWAFAQALAEKIGWFPANTAKVIAGLDKRDFDQLLDTPTEPSTVRTEADVLHGMRSQKRVVLATLGGGAASLASTYRDLHGTFVIWIEDEGRQPTASAGVSTSSRPLFESQAEVRVKLKKNMGFQRAKLTLEEKAAECVLSAVTKLAQVLQDNKDIVERKQRYVALGCRGDWPEVQPPEWNPVIPRSAAPSLTPDSEAAVV